MADLTWDLEAHTVGKHVVLKSYLEAWLPVISSAESRVLFFDGFAGPGVYSAGEIGSPLIALETLLEHRRHNRCVDEVNFFFFEKDEQRASRLRQEISARYPSLPEKIGVQVASSAYHDAMGALLTELENNERTLAPSFLMIDPFGVSDVPMSLVESFLSYRKTEIYFSLMYENVNRFVGSPEFEKHLTALYGCEDWKGAIQLRGEERKAFLYNLYEARLKEAGAKHVVKFELYQGGRLKYAIFFATKHLKGADLMKQAIWKIVPDGTFRYVGASSGQLDVLADAAADCSPLMDQLAKQFAGAGWVPVERVVDYVRSDATEFHSGHVKKRTLKPMEDHGRLEVEPSSRKRKGTYPDGTILRFL